MVRLFREHQFLQGLLRRGALKQLKTRDSSSVYPITLADACVLEDIGAYRKAHTLYMTALNSSRGPKMRAIVYGRLSSLSLHRASYQMGINEGDSVDFSLIEGRRSGGLSNENDGKKCEKLRFRVFLQESAYFARKSLIYWNLRSSLHCLASVCFRLDDIPSAMIASIAYLCIAERFNLRMGRREFSTVFQGKRGRIPLFFASALLNSSVSSSSSNSPAFTTSSSFVTSASSSVSSSPSSSPPSSPASPLQNGAKASNFASKRRMNRKSACLYSGKVSMESLKILVNRLLAHARKKRQAFFTSTREDCFFPFQICQEEVLDVWLILVKCLDLQDNAFESLEVLELAGLALARMGPFSEINTVALQRLFLSFELILCRKLYKLTSSKDEEENFMKSVEAVKRALCDELKLKMARNDELPSPKISLHPQENLNAMKSSNNTHFEVDCGSSLSREREHSYKMRLPHIKYPHQWILPEEEEEEELFMNKHDDQLERFFSSFRQTSPMTFSSLGHIIEQALNLENARVYPQHSASSHTQIPSFGMNSYTKTAGDAISSLPPSDHIAFASSEAEISGLSSTHTRLLGELFFICSLFEDTIKSRKQGYSVDSLSQFCKSLMSLADGKAKCVYVGKQQSIDLEDVCGEDVNESSRKPFSMKKIVVYIQLHLLRKCIRNCTQLGDAASIRKLLLLRSFCRVTESDWRRLVSDCMKIALLGIEGSASSNNTHTTFAGVREGWRDSTSLALEMMIYGMVKLGDISSAIEYYLFFLQLKMMDIVYDSRVCERLRGSDSPTILKHLKADTPVFKHIHGSTASSQLSKKCMYTSGDDSIPSDAKNVFDLFGESQHTLDAVDVHTLRLLIGGQSSGFAQHAAPVSKSLQESFSSEFSSLKWGVASSASSSSSDFSSSSSSPTPSSSPKKPTTSKAPTGFINGLRPRHLARWYRKSDVWAFEEGVRKHHRSVRTPVKQAALPREGLREQKAAFLLGKKRRRINIIGYQQLSGS